MKFTDPCYFSQQNKTFNSSPNNRRSSLQFSKYSNQPEPQNSTAIKFTIFSSVFATHSTLITASFATQNSNDLSIVIDLFIKFLFETLFLSSPQLADYLCSQLNSIETPVNLLVYCVHIKQIQIYIENKVYVFILVWTFPN